MLSYNNLITAMNLFPTQWVDRVYADKTAYFSLLEYPYENERYLAFAQGKSVKTSYISQTRANRTRTNMARKVFDPSANEWTGIVVVSYDIQYQDMIAAAFDLGEQGIVAVYGQERTIYHTENGVDTKYGLALRDYRPAQDGSAVVKLAGRDTLVNAVRSDTTGWLI